MTLQTPMPLYRAYGMMIASDIELPELTRVDPVPDPDLIAVDVRIALGAVPGHLPDRDPPKAWVDVDQDACLLLFKTIGRFLVKNGDSILVQKDDQASFDDLRGFLVGSALAAIAHQRGLVPLHVSAVLSPDGVIAFTGESGAGKSTLAAHVNRVTGWPLISDDVSGLYQTENGFSVESGVHTVKLWDDALQSLDRTSDGLKRDLTRFNKFHAIDSEKFLSGRFPLKQLICLEWGDALDFSHLNGRKAFEASLNAVYRPELASLCGNRSVVVAAAMALASAIDVSKLTRPKSDEIGEGVLDSIKIALGGRSEIVS